MAPSRNILLVNPWIYDFTAYDFWMKPLGLLSAAALIREHAVGNVSYIDCLDRFHPGLARPVKSRPDGRGPFPKEAVAKPSVIDGVPRRFSRYGIPVPLFEAELGRVPRPDAVLLTCAMTYWYPGVQAVSEIVRRRFGSVPIVLGGVYATLCPEHAELNSGADLVARGPAERSLFPALREVLGDGLPASPDAGGIDGLPPPAFDLLRDRTWLPLLTSRGCPFRCSFCASALLAPAFEQRSPAIVSAEIAGLHARFGTEHFAFYDDALLAAKDRHAIPLLEEISAARLPVSFHTPNGLHVREIDATTARLLRRSGFRSIYLSLESADDAFLRDRSPKTSPADLAPALAALESHGYDRREINVYLIMGLPGQAASAVEAGIRLVRGLGAVPRVAFFSPIPGTEEWAVLEGRGLVSGDTDPLLHNKIAHAYLASDISRAEYEAVKRSLAGDFP